MLALARHRSPQLRATAIATRKRAAALRERAAHAIARRGWRGFQGASDVEETACAECGKAIEIGSGRYNVGSRPYHMKCFDPARHVVLPETSAPQDKGGT